jgi:hypothetical protein
MPIPEPAGGKKIVRYGLEFPAHYTDVQIELLCWKHWREPEFKAGNIVNPHDCFYKAVRYKFSNGEQVLTDDEWISSRWSEEHVFDFSNESGIITWGCASSSKSWDYGLLALMDWYVDPDDTITLMASTSKDALLKRTFAAVVHYHQLFRQKGGLFPGRYVPSKFAVVLSEDDLVAASTKTGVWGIAVTDGPVSEAVGKIRGMHAPHVRLIVDELSAMPPAVWEKKLRHNLRVGTKDLKIIGLTNIDALDDLAGRNSEPIGGWGSVTMDDERWRTAQGIVRRHDGLRSPAIVEPGGALKYPHLLNQETLNEAIKDEGGNADAPAIVSMYRSWPPDVTSRPVIVAPSQSIAWGMRRDPLMRPSWLYPPTIVAGLDGSGGGDAVALQFILAGIVANGDWWLYFEPEETVPIKSGAGEMPVNDQILAYCLPRFAAIDLKPQHCGIDDTGAQGLADAFARAWSPGIQRYSFGSRASEMAVSAFNKQPAREKYGDTTTEINFLYREYGQYKQLKNVGDKIISQVTTRETLQRGGKLVLIDKKTYKKNTGRRSPDQMDAGAMALGIVRHVLCLAPGSKEVSPDGPMEQFINPGVDYDPEIVSAFNNLKTTYGS